MVRFIRAVVSIAVVVLVLAAPVARAATPRDACFGGSAEPVATGEDGPREVFVANGFLYWRANDRHGGQLRRKNLSTAEIVSPDDIGDLKVVDARDAVGITGTNMVLAVDLRTKASRKIYEDFMEDPLVFSALGLDGDYLYFNRRVGPVRSLAETGLFRVKRDGGAAPERVAAEPPGNEPFVVGGGFAYWIRKADGGLVIGRRRLTPDAPIETVVRLERLPFQHTLKLANGRIYFPDKEAIWSAPVDGKGGPVRHVFIGSGGTRDLLVERRCLYWTDGRAIKRAALDARGAGTSEVIADDRSYLVGHFDTLGATAFAIDLATDGRFLYWADSRGGRLMRVGRSARRMAPPPERVARQNAPEPRAIGPAQSLMAGEGWGCATYGAHGQTPLQCWRSTSGQAAGPLAAFGVESLNRSYLRAGPDRLCAMATGGSKCWPWSEIAAGRATESSGALSGASFVNHGPTTLTVGGTFMCEGDMGPLRCTGDDTFGQLGKGARGPPLGMFVALGTWHGCANEPEDITCWGRGDGGQLGFAPVETCRAPSGRDVPCSRSPRKLPFAVPRGVLLAGDMFTCVAGYGDRQLRCWGASRDGLFGTAAACPPHLRTAWPTRSGEVQAPRATCSLTPVVVPGFSKTPGNPHYVSVGPRGICAVDSGHMRCAGAIPTPTADVREPQVNSGDEPSACGILGADSVCWGAGYSPPDAPGKPVTIVLDRSPNPTASVFDEPAPAGATWDAACRIHSACSGAVAPIERCKDDAAPAEAWSALAEKAGALVGKTVRVRGPLVVGRLGDEVETCAPGQCCTPRWRAITIGGAAEELALSSLSCWGDDSRKCCNAPALGQTVIATGVLSRDYYAAGTWVLSASTVCQP
jgi:hypothetical protein